MTSNSYRLKRNKTKNSLKPRAKDFKRQKTSRTITIKNSKTRKVCKRQQNSTKDFKRL